MGDRGRLRSRARSARRARAGARASTGGKRSPSEAGAIVKLAAAALLVALAIAFALLYAITLAPAYGPPLVVTLLGDRATPLLARLNGFFAAHRRGIGAGLCLAFAVLLAVAGLKALL